MSELTIRTNNAPRPVLDWHELTEKERAQFDWTDGEDGHYFARYKGDCYCLSEFTRVPEVDALKGWDGIHNDSYFSGILFRWHRDEYGTDCESVVMATFFS